MNVEEHDPFDGRWEEVARTYRVRFWSLKEGQTRTDPPLVYESTEQQLADVEDVIEAVEWARTNANGRTYTLYAVVDRGNDRGLIHLCGTDPTKHG